MNKLIKNQIIGFLEKEYFEHEDDLNRKDVINSDEDKEYNIKWLRKYSEAIEIIERINSLEISDE